ncbi:MAG: universal stress protein [Mariniphaga sp.]
MKKILIALEMDATSQRVAETGYILGKTMKAEVNLLHVISNKVYNYSRMELSHISGNTNESDSAKSHSDNMDNQTIKVQAFLDESKHQLGDRSIKTLIKEGNFGDEILNTGKELEADLIVMGAHSQSSFENTVLGSVAEKVLLKTSIPILIIPTQKHKVIEVYDY